MHEAVIEKMVHGGQGMGTLSDGRKVFVWGALPGEKVSLRLLKNKKSFAEGIAEDILTSSPCRTLPKEPEVYLATSPWQILSYKAENIYKKEIIIETFEREGVKLPEFSFVYPDSEYHYRNKMEYSFYGDYSGVHLALYNRGSHKKQIVEGSALAMPVIDTAAQNLTTVINDLGVRAGDLKSVIIRCSQAGEVVAALFVKSANLPKLPLPEGLKGLSVVYSNPKSPASVVTKILYTIDDISLTDTLNGKNIKYDVFSFFQVNLPIFTDALSAIREAIGSPKAVVDLYSGVGGIGLSVASERVTLVELDPASAAMAKINLEQSGLKGDVSAQSAERVLEAISSDCPLLLDPPRAGLHKDVLRAILDKKPPIIAYLSCNTITQARDMALLASGYTITKFEGYNFFPKTPHIETLAILSVSR